MKWSLVYLACLLSIVVVVPAGRAQLQGTDQTRTVSAGGADVVRAVITLSRALDMSTTEEEELVMEHFIRELAYVESRDGLDTEEEGGGIWSTSSAVFEQTKQFVATNPDYNDTIYQNFDTVWSDLDHMDLEIPLYSGLAVKVHLLRLHQENTILTSTNTDADRAHYWLTHFKNGEGHTEVWIERVNQLREVESKPERK